MLVQALTAYANREVEALINPRVRDFTRMNHFEFYGSKVKEDPQEFIIEANKVLYIMGMTLVEKAELIAYNIKVVARFFLICERSNTG